MLLRQLKTIASRSHSTLMQDMLGAASLVVILLVGLHFPTFI